MKKIGAGVITFFLKVVPKFLKTGKAIKMLLIAGSFTGYAYLFNWKFALLILVSIFIHELGHIYAMKRCGMKTRGIYFIPFFGAAAVSEDQFKTRDDECYIALMGPLWGLGTSLIVLGIYLISGIQWFGGAAAWIALVNLFNLLPISPLDGGRVFKSIVISINGYFGLSVMLLIVGGAIVAAFKFEIVLFAILGIIGLLEFLFERHKLLKVTKMYNVYFKNKEFLDKIIAMFHGKSEDQIILIWKEFTKGLSIEKLVSVGLHYNDASSLIQHLKTMKEIEIKKIEKLKEKLPSEKLTVKRMFMWGGLFILLTVVLFTLMFSMLSIPGVEIATEFFAR
jgi:Zn-dependent protease